MKLPLAYLKRIFFSPCVYLCIIFTALISFSGMPKENFISEGVLSAFDGMLDISSYRKLIMIFACIPFTSTFCREYRSGYISFVTARGTPRKYILSHIVLCFFTAFITAAVGMAVSVFLPCCVYDFFIPADDINSGAIVSLYYTGHEYLFFILKLFDYSFSIAAWSISGLALSSIFVDPFIAAASPLVFSYMLEMFTVDSRWFPDLWHLSLSYTDISDNAFTSCVYIIAVFLVPAVIFAVIFGQVTVRRLRNEIT